MTEIRNGKKVITTPVSAEDLKDIHIGDTIYIDGYIVTGRDAVHDRVVTEGLEMPVDIRGGIDLHAGPIVRDLGDGHFEIGSTYAHQSIETDDEHDSDPVYKQMHLSIGW